MVSIPMNENQIIIPLSFERSYSVSRWWIDHLLNHSTLAHSNSGDLGETSVGSSFKRMAMTEKSFLCILYPRKLDLVLLLVSWQWDGIETYLPHHNNNIWLGGALACNFKVFVGTVDVYDATMALVVGADSHKKLVGSFYVYENF